MVLFKNWEENAYKARMVANFTYRSRATAQMQAKEGGIRKIQNILRIRNQAAKARTITGFISGFRNSQVALLAETKRQQNVEKMIQQGEKTP